MGVIVVGVQVFMVMDLNILRNFQGKSISEACDSLGSCDKLRLPIIMIDIRYLASPGFVLSGELRLKQKSALRLADAS